VFWLIIAITLWGTAHSLLASTEIKGLFQRAFGNGFMRFYRLFYNVFAVISFVPVLYLIIILPDENLYQVPAPYNYIMRAGQGLSIFFLFVAVMQTDLLSFAGLRQLFREEEKGKLVTSGLYNYVRHPLYTFSLAILWLSPSMSINSFIVFLALTIYIFIGIIFEERKLLREFGQSYADYRAVTPMLIPSLNFIRNK
jgi:protein-S-isoprenylcysteine O-methyltransferase Ste14